MTQSVHRWFVPRRARIALCLLVLLYIPVAWIGGRSPGSTRIFSPQHRQLRQEFFSMEQALRDQLVLRCRRDGIRNIYFFGSDVASPYAIDAVEAIPGCALHRDTIVTLVAPARKLICSSLVVREKVPNAWNPVHVWEDPGPLKGELVPVGQWQSEEGAFRFQLMRSRACLAGSDRAKEGSQ